MNTPASTIAALSTSPGRGAIAVVRLTGDEAHNIFTGVIAEKEKFRKEAARRIGIYTIIDTVNIYTDNDDAAITAVDEVTAVKYNAPHSYTGENMVEIFCHGGVVIPAKILDNLFRQGAKAAGRGEFSRRALINGKIGVLKAESIRELIDSQTETHLRSAQLAYFGKQSKLIERLKHEIIAILSDVESRIEFDEDDDVAESKLQQISANKKALASIAEKLQDELRRGDRVRALDDGIIVTIAGPANAGKSSLFNEILGYDRSIVHDCPGTTRDIVSERLNFDGETVKLFDSAGIRETGDAVERLGMDRTRSAVAEAHAVLWVTSAVEAFGDVEREEILEAAMVRGDSDDGANAESLNTQDVDISDNYGDSRRDVCCGKNRLAVIINKIDEDESFKANTVDTVDIGDRSKSVVINIDTKKESTMNYVGTNHKGEAILSPRKRSYLIEKKRFCEEHDLKYVETSITQKFNQAQLFDAISVVLKGVMRDTPAPAIIINERHRGIVETVVRDIRDCLDNFDREEVAAHCLRSALDRFAEFSGHIGSEEVLDGIFEKFCIGK
ncbi:tRNA modification GTPase [Fibrobacteres bacterium R8-0-B4]